MADLSNIKKGDTIYVVNSDSRLHHHSAYEAVVLSAGLRWVTVSRSQRFDRNGNGEYGFRAWSSREDYEIERAASAAWSELRAFVNRYGGAPKTLTVQDIHAALRILCGEVDAKGGDRG